MKYAKVQFYRDRKGEHRWTLLAPNGLKIADCAEGYSSASNCKRAYARVAHYVFSGAVEK